MARLRKWFIHHLSVKFILKCHQDAVRKMEEGKVERNGLCRHAKEMTSVVAILASSIFATSVFASTTETCIGPSRAWAIQRRTGLHVIIRHHGCHGRTWRRTGRQWRVDCARVSSQRVGRLWCVRHQSCRIKLWNLNIDGGCPLVPGANVGLIGIGRSQIAIRVHTKTKILHRERGRQRRQRRHGRLVR